MQRIFIKEVIVMVTMLCCNSITYAMESDTIKEYTTSFCKVIENALDYEKEEMMNMLAGFLRQGVNPNEIMSDSSLPLHSLLRKTISYHEDMREEVKLFIEYGANPEIECGENKKTAYMLSQEYDPILQQQEEIEKKNVPWISYTTLMKRERANYKNKIKCLKEILVGSYYDKNSIPRNPNCLFSKLPTSIVKAIGLYVLGRINSKDMHAQQ